MIAKPINSPTSIKLKAVMSEISELDEEIGNITQELSDKSCSNTDKSKSDFPNISISTPTKKKRSATTATNTAAATTNTSSKKINCSPILAKTPNKTNNISLQLEDLMSDDDSDESMNERTATSYSPNSYKSTSSGQYSPQQDEQNRLFSQSVSVLKNRSHSMFSHWIDPQDEEDVIYFPKQMKEVPNYRSITELDRINETQLKRLSKSKKFKEEKEIEYQIECPFHPTKSTPTPKISPEKEIIIRNRSKIVQDTTPKVIRFIDKNSERIVKNSRKKPPSSHNQVVDMTPSPKTKKMSKKKIQQSCERLSKPRQSNNNSSSDDEDYDSTENANIKRSDPAAVDRLFRSSTKPKQQSPEEKSTENYSFKSEMDPNSKMIAEYSTKDTDLFENSVQVAEENYQRQRKIKKYNEMCEASGFSFRPQLNRSPPHFSVSETDYSNLHSSSSQNSKAKDKSPNSNSKARRNCHITPTKTKPDRKFSDEVINDILSDIESQLNHEWAQTKC